MNDNKRIILKKIENLISKRQLQLLNEFPIIHEINDGIIIRSFNGWGDEDIDIKFRKINNIDNPNDESIYFYLPKGSYLEQKNYNTKTITCLSGTVELTIDNKINNLTSYSQIDVNCIPFNGKAIENSYLLITTTY